MRGLTRSSVVLVGFLVVLAGCSSEPAVSPAVSTDASTTTAPDQTAATRPTPTTIATPVTEAEDPGPYADLSWTRHQFDEAGSLFQVDDLYVAFDSSRWRGFAAEDSGEMLDDEVSYYWWSSDGETWERGELPDVFEGLESWRFSGWPDRKLVSVWGEDGPVEFEFSVDPSAPDGSVMNLAPAPEAADAEDRPQMDLPEMGADGLVPAGWALFGETLNNRPAEVTVGAVTLIAGAIEFSFPDQVAEEIPEWNGASCCRGHQATGEITFDYEMNNRRTHSVSWAVDGHMLSADVTLLTGDEPEIIHSGWVELPDWLAPIPGDGGFGPGGGFTIPVLWRSEDGGASYTATQPDPLAAYPALGSDGASAIFIGDLALIEHEGRFLAFAAHHPDSGPTTEVWSSPDGTEWNLEAELAGFSFEPPSVARYNDIFSMTSDRAIHFSRNGVDWTPELSRGLDFIVADQGFIWVGSREMLMSTDSSTWFTIPLPGDIRDPYVRVVGDLLVVSDFTSRFSSHGVWVAALP